MTSRRESIDSDYEKLRQRLIRFSNFHPESKEPCHVLWHLSHHQVQLAPIIVSDIMTLMEMYRELAHQNE